jgi:hypothetical protein
MKVDDFSDSTVGSPKDILTRLHNIFDYFYANRVPGTYLSYDNGCYLDFVGSIGLQIYVRDHNQTCLNIAEAALQEAYENRNPSTGLLQYGNSTGGWETGYCSGALPILWAMGGMSVLNSTFETYYENIVKSYSNYYNTSTGLFYSELKSDGTKADSTCWAVYYISQPKAITMFYNAYDITGNSTYKNITAHLIDGWWKTRGTHNLPGSHAWNADANASSIYSYVNHYDQAAWVMVLARLVREGEKILYYDGNSVNVTEILEESLDALDTTFWYETEKRYGYRASYTTGTLSWNIPEMYFGSTDRAILMACTALNNFTYMEHAKNDLINAYDDIKVTSGDGAGLIPHSPLSNTDIRLRQNLIFAGTGYLFYNKYGNSTFKTNADAVLNKTTFFKESAGVYRDKNQGSFTGRKQKTFWFIINEVYNKNESSMLTIIPQANFFDAEWYDPISSGYMVCKSGNWTSFIGLGEYPIVDSAVYNGKLYAASCNSLYVYDGSGWDVINAPDDMFSLEPYADKLIVGVKGGLYSYNGTTFTLIFTVPNYIRVLGVYNTTLYAGTALDKTPTLYYCNGSPDDPADWHIDTAFSSISNFSGPFGSIDSFVAYNNKIYISSEGTVYSYDGTGWSIAKTYDDVCAYLDMGVYNGKLYLATRDLSTRCPLCQGGSGFCGRVIEFDGNNWTTVFDHDYWISSLETYGGELYVGTFNKIYIYNGTHWKISFQNEEGAYYAISFTIFNNAIYVGMSNANVIMVPEYLSIITLLLVLVFTTFAVIMGTKFQKP